MLNGKDEGCKNEKEGMEISDERIEKKNRRGVGREGNEKAGKDGKDLKWKRKKK